MAKFKVGDKVRIVVGFYPTGYVFPCIRPSDHQIGMVGHVKRVDQDYPAGYLPDYRVEFEEGGFDQIDEVHLELVAERPEGKIPTSQDLLEEILSLVRSNDEKLAAIEERLAAHEEAARPPYVLNLTATVLP